MNGKSARLIFVSLLVLAAVLLGACGPVQAGAAEGLPALGPKVQADGIAFTGIVEAINGNQWTISGQVVTVDERTAMEANIAIGDTVKVEATIGLDGAFMATQIEPNAGDDSVSTPDPLSTESPDEIETPDPVSTETPDSNSSETPSVDPSNETSGAVEAISGDVWTIAGMDYLVTTSSEIKGLIQVGDNVKLEYFVNPDGTLIIGEIKSSNETGSVSQEDNHQSGNSVTVDDNHNNDSLSGDSHTGPSSGGSDDSDKSGSSGDSED